MRTMMVKKDELVISDIKKRIASEIINKYLQDLKTAVNEIEK